VPGNGSCWVIYLDKFMLKSQLFSHMRCHRWRTETLSRVVAAGEVGDAAFAGEVGLGFGHFAGDEGVSAGGDGGFKVTLRAACAPCYVFNSYIICS
jgi:hypothetical protein